MVVAVVVCKLVFSHLLDSEVQFEYPMFLRLAVVEFQSLEPFLVPAPRFELLLASPPLLVVEVVAVVLLPSVAR
ncbi:hypothetical protein D3C86_1732350 [compost metagenome]